MATYAIGDIQGCQQELLLLLNEINFDGNRDRLWFTGDLVNRGPESLATLRFVKNLGDTAIVVLGNHDLHFLSVSQGIKKAKRSDNLEPLLKAPDIEELTAWLRQWPLAMALDEKHTMVHAGLYPGWSTAQLLTYSQEIAEQLKSVKWCQLLENMYGDGPPKWDEKLSGKQRQRFIINATTRMRFVRPSLALNLSVKSAPKDAPSSLRPWFDIPNQQLKAEERILFGHWAALQGNTSSNQFVALDTGYVWGNTMTLWHKETNECISVSA